MRLDRQTAGALVAGGGVLFLLFVFGIPKLNNMLETVDIDVPYQLINCCGCFGIVTLAAPLALLAFVLMKRSKDESAE